MGEGEPWRASRLPEGTPGTTYFIPFTLHTTNPRPVRDQGHFHGDRVKPGALVSYSRFSALLPGPLLLAFWEGLHCFCTVHLPNSLEPERACSSHPPHEGPSSAGKGTVLAALLTAFQYPLSSSQHPHPRGLPCAGHRLCTGLRRGVSQGLSTLRWH